MEKIKIDDKLKKIEEIEIPWKDKTILVKNNIGVEDRVILFERYVQDFFENKNSSVVRFISSKYGFILGIIDRCTNITIEHLDEKNINIFVDKIISDGLWKKICYNIDNFDEVKKDLYGLTKMISEERLAEKQVGQVLDDVYQKIVEFISNLDTEKIESLTKDFTNGIKQLEDNGIILPPELSQKEK